MSWRAANKAKAAVTQQPRPDGRRMAFSEDLLRASLPTLRGVLEDQQRKKESLEQKSDKFKASLTALKKNKKKQMTELAKKGFVLTGNGTCFGISLALSAFTKGLALPVTVWSAWRLATDGKEIAEKLGTLRESMRRLNSVRSSIEFLNDRIEMLKENIAEVNDVIKQRIQQGP